MTNPSHKAELAEAYQDAKAVLVELARKDINAFVEYVMRDEHTNKPIEQASTHLRMQTACEDHDRLILWSHVEAGKSFQIAVARVLFILGTHPNATVAIVSDTHAQASKIIRLIGKYIENSDEYHEVFPHVKRGEPWTSTALYLEPLPGRIPPKDPNVQATNIGGNITGSRVSHMIWDDILDLENTATAAYRNKVYTWLKSAECMGRLLEGAPVWCIGNAYHPDDALHRLAREPLWHFMRLAVEDEHGQPTWPERWSADRIARKRLDAGPLEFARQMMCLARDDSESRFKREDLDACCARGRGVPWVHTLSALLSQPWPLPPGALRALPAATEPQPDGGTDGMDDAQAAKRLDAARAKALERGRGRGNTGGDAVRRTMAKRGASQGEGGHDPAKLFPDVAKAQAAAHANSVPVEVWDVGVGVGTPDWLTRRIERERCAAGAEGGLRPTSRGEVAPSACAAGARGALVGSVSTPKSQTLPHIVHTPQTGPMPSVMREGFTTDTAVTLGPDPLLAAEDIADARQRASDRLRKLTGLERDPVLDQLAAVTRAGMSEPSHATAEEALAQARRAMAGHTANPKDGRRALGPMGGGGSSQKMATPVGSIGAENLDLEKMPTPGLESGPLIDNESGGFVGAPAGVEVALDSYGWLGSWLGDPGTPHRNDQGWPIHPRSLAQLKRMGVETYTGVDLAVQKHSAADYTVLYTIAVYPPDKNGHRTRRVLEIQRGKWYAMDICKRIIDVHDRFDSTVFVENVAAQDYIRQMILEGFERPDAGRWLFGYTTGRNKANPEFGVEHLAAEFAREQWIFPVPPTWTPGSPEGTVAPELEQNFNEVLYFDPREHYGDVLMAMWLATEAERVTSVDTRPAEIGVRSFG